MQCRATWGSARLGQETEDGKEKAWFTAWAGFSMESAKQGKQLRTGYFE